MNLNEFMVQANRTIFDACKSRKYLTIGLANECGEALGALKKYYRGDYDLEELRKRLVSELGDVLWYVAQACMALDVTLDDVVARNVQKLLKRYPEGAFDVYFSENRSSDDR